MPLLSTYRADSSYTRTPFEARTHENGESPESVRLRVSRSGEFIGPSLAHTQAARCLLTFTQWIVVKVTQTQMSQQRFTELVIDATGDHLLQCTRNSITTAFQVTVTGIDVLVTSLPFRLTPSQIPSVNVTIIHLLEPLRHHCLFFMFFLPCKIVPQRRTIFIKGSGDRH